MFNDDEDYGFLTGGLGDLDGDGRVDFVEYMNEEDDYQRIMGSNDDDYSVLDDDDDLEDEYNDEEYSDFDDDADEDESDDEGYISDGFDISKLSLTIGATTSLNYDGKPIDQVFGVSEENKNNSAPKSTSTKQQSTQSIERQSNSHIHT